MEYDSARPWDYTTLHEMGGLGAIQGHSTNFYTMLSSHEMLFFPTEDGRLPAFDCQCRHLMANFFVHSSSTAGEGFMSCLQVIFLPEKLGRKMGLFLKQKKKALSIAPINVHPVGKATKHSKFSKHPAMH